MIDNPRFPHWCRIYRIEDDTSFSDGEEVVLYEGECRKWDKSPLRGFLKEGVIKGDFAIHIGRPVEGLRTGDLVDVKDKQGLFEQCVINAPYAGNIGTTIPVLYANN